MDIEVLDYLRGLQEGDYGLYHLIIVGLSGLGSVTLARRLFVDRQSFDRSGLIVLSLSAPILGLILTSVTYPCPSCEAPPGCNIVTVGVPLPQATRERDPLPGVAGRCWMSLTRASPAAVTVNFLLGTLGLPCGVFFFRPRLSPETVDPTEPLS